MINIKIFLASLILVFSNTIFAAEDFGDHDCRQCRNPIMPSVHGSTGKWLDHAVPHRNWVCDEIEDLGEAAQQCEMCERETIRYVHFMKHNDHDPLEVGCICAGHMEGDLNAAESRDRELRARANRRSNWLSLLGWKVSKKGNDYLRTRPNMTDDETHFITISKSRFGHYSAIIDGSYLKLWYDNKDRAKLAAFDYLWPSKMSFS